MVSHLDHSEHSVQIIVTEQGVADLRGKSPAERARTIIENCAHPEYRGILRDYVKLAGSSHSPQTLSRRLRHARRLPEKRATCARSIGLTSLSRGETVPGAFGFRFLRMKRYRPMPVQGGFSAA